MPGRYWALGKWLCPCPEGGAHELCVLTQALTVRNQGWHLPLSLLGLCLECI